MLFFKLRARDLNFFSLNTETNSVEIIDAHLKHLPSECQIEL